MKAVTLVVTEEPEPIIIASPTPEVPEVEDTIALVEETTTSSTIEPENEEVQEVAAPQPEIATPAVEATEAAVPEPIKPAKEIGFEITNPDDVDIDDKGQLGLF